MGRNLFSFLHVWEYGYVVMSHNWWVMPKKHCFLTKSNHFWEKSLGESLRFSDMPMCLLTMPAWNKQIEAQEVASVFTAFTAAIPAPQHRAQVLPQPNGEQRHEGSCNSPTCINGCFGRICRINEFFLPQ